LKKIQCPANSFCLSDLRSSDIDPGAEPFVDGLMTEFYHTTAVPYSKPPEEGMRQYLGIFS
jgi:hypothetical protein